MRIIEKMLSREWLGTIGMLSVASVAFLQGQIEFTAWAAFCGGVLTAYQGIKKAGEIKMAKATNI